MATKPTRSVEQPSDEATTEGLRLARAQGEAYQRMLEYFVQHVATGGGTQRAGDYLVGYAVEEAEGMYHYRAGQLQWEEPAADTNLHIEIAVCDAGDGRFLPYLTVYATLLDAQGRELGTHQQPFLWHPTIYHYGRNWRVPGDGRYSLRVRIEPPEFPRHDKRNGRRYAVPIEVTFHDIAVKTGRKG